MTLLTTDVLNYFYLTENSCPRFIGNYDIQHKRLISCIIGSIHIHKKNTMIAKPKFMHSFIPKNSFQL